MADRQGGRIRRWLVRLVLAGVALSLLLVLPLRWLDPPTSAFMLRARLGGVTVDQEWADWAALGTALPIAVVASEDQTFPHHRGFDLAQIRAAVDNGAARGASTISQQVAKNLYLWPGRSWVRKGLEAWLTVLIEATWSKRRILEVYLNIAEFGPGLYGAWAASDRYYGRPPDLISLSEAARLVAVLPSPSRIDPTGGSPYVAERARWIVAQVDRLGGPAYLAELD
jgi:monofunctional biosynthetic peptidoglycan transglycosylase